MTQKQANLILVTVSMGWGTSYIFMKLCVDTVSPLTIIALRFGIAFIVMMAIFFKKMIHIDAKTLKYSAIVGALLFGIFLALLYGMKNTTASSAGFLTSTTVILVPILQAFITRKRPSNKIISGVLVVSIGLAFLTIRDGFTFANGSLYCLAAALLYAVHIVVTNFFAREVDALQLGIYQLGFSCLYATIGTFIFETPVLPHEAIHWFALLGLALISSAYGFVMQTIAQQYTTPESTGFLFSLEPIFSAVFAFLFLHENMGMQGYVGALLILAGVFIANSISKKQLLLKEIKL
ncbi:DMT family transporter [Paenibacillus sp. BSR1-1]|uniref:DMT family transporter n=1 Tax=Paenibacillus sp. BSR1-1 TaxID=3020845 RepID=UPI0025AED562|nr:DMT family transporter [Paenibacillus sp. BSR1-1]MDN3019591.1 DMT family transporter [Paenibacillus sp. BSR1-1]